MKYLSKPILYATQSEDVYNNGGVHDSCGDTGGTGQPGYNNTDNIDPTTITPEDGSGDKADPTNDNEIENPGDPAKHEGSGSDGSTSSHDWKLKKIQEKTLYENEEMYRREETCTLQEFISDPPGEDRGHYKQTQAGNNITYARYYAETYQYYCSCGATKQPFRCRLSADPSTRQTWAPSDAPKYEFISQHEFDINESSIFKGSRTETSATGIQRSYYQQIDGICHKITVSSMLEREISSYVVSGDGQSMQCLNPQCGAIINGYEGQTIEITGDWHQGNDTSNDESGVHEIWNICINDELFSEKGTVSTELSTYESSEPELVYDNDCTLYHVTANYEVKLTSFAPMMSSWKECPACGTKYDSDYYESTNPERSPKLEYDMIDGHKNWVRVGEPKTVDTGSFRHDYGQPYRGSYDASSDVTLIEGPNDRYDVRNPDDPTNEQLGTLHEYTSVFYKVITPKACSCISCNRCGDVHIEQEYDDIMGTPTKLSVGSVPAPDLSSWDPYPTTSCEHQLSPNDDKYIKKVPRPKFKEFLSTDTKTEHHSNEYLYDHKCELYNFDKIYARDVYLEHEGYDYHYRCISCNEEVSTAYHDESPYPKLEYSEYKFSCDTNIYPVGSTEHISSEFADKQTTQSSWIQIDTQYDVETPNVSCTDGTGCRGTLRGDMSANVQWTAEYKNVWNECIRCGIKENKHVEFIGSPTLSVLGEYAYIEEPTFEITSYEHEYEYENVYSHDQISTVVHDTETSVKYYTAYIDDASCEKHSYAQDMVRTLSHDLPYNIQKQTCKYCHNVGMSSYSFGAIKNISGDWEDYGPPVDISSIGEIHDFEGSELLSDEILQYTEPYSVEFLSVTNVNKPNEAACKKYNAIAHMSANIDYKSHTYSKKCNHCKNNIEISNDSEYYPDPDPDTLLTSDMTYISTDYEFISSDHTWGNELTDTQPAGYPSTITISRTVTQDYATQKPGTSMCEKYDKIVTLTAELTGYEDKYYHICTQCQESAVSHPGSGLYYKPKNEEDMTDSDMTDVSIEWKLVSSDHIQVLSTAPKPGTEPIQYNQIVSTEISTIYDYKYRTPSGKDDPCKYDVVTYLGERIQPKLSGEISSWYECQKCGQFLESNSNGYEISSVDNGPSYFRPYSNIEPEILSGQVRHKGDFKLTTTSADEDVGNTLPVQGCLAIQCGSKEYETRTEPNKSSNPTSCFSTMNKNEYVRHYRHHRTVYYMTWKCISCDYSEPTKRVERKIQKDLIMHGPMGINDETPDDKGYVLYRSKPTDEKTNIHHTKSDFQAKPYELDPDVKSKMLDKVVESDKSEIRIQVDKQDFQNWLNDANPESWEIQGDYLVPSEKHMKELPSIIWIETKDLYHPMEYYYNKKQHFYCTKNCGTTTENGPVTTANGQVQTIITKIEENDPYFPKKPTIDKEAIPIGTRVISRTRSERRKKYFRQKPNGETDPNIQYAKYPNNLGDNAGEKRYLSIQVPARF